MYAYLDESEFSYKDKTYIAYGILITEKPIEVSLISNALVELANYQNTLSTSAPTYKTNRKTLNNKFFHACKDSSDAHSCICKTLIQIDGEFHIDCVEKGKNSLNNQAIETAFEILMRNGDAKMFFEERPNLNEEIIDSLYIDFEKQLPDILTWNLYYPHYCAHPYRKVVKKDNPGCQIIDFIIWAYQKHINDKNSVWYNYINENCLKRSRINTSSSDFDNDNIQKFFISKQINNGLNNDYIVNKYYETYKSESFLDLFKHEEITYIFIEKVIYTIIQTLEILRRKLDKNKKDYFEQQIIYAIDNKRKIQAQNLLFVFLKAFDSYKLYDLYKTEDDIKMLFVARKIIAQAVQLKDDYGKKIRTLIDEVFKSLGYKLP